MSASSKSRSGVKAPEAPEPAAARPQPEPSSVATDESAPRLCPEASGEDGPGATSAAGPTVAESVALPPTAPAADDVRLAPERPRHRIPWSTLILLLLVLAAVPFGMRAWRTHRLDPYLATGRVWWAWLINQGPQPATNAPKIKYHCPMHPGILYDHPGTCPICGMTLVPVKGAAKSSARAAGHKSAFKTPTTPEGLVVIDPRDTQVMGVATAMVGRRRLVRDIRTTGRVDYNEKQEKMVPSWIAGRIDKLYVTFTGQNIRKGEPMASIYSPELVSTQQEYLLSLDYVDRLRREGAMADAIGQAESLLQASRERLRLWGVTESQIDTLTKTKRIKYHTIVYATMGGTVITKSTHEGMYVKEGTVLFTIAPLNTVWVYADVFEKDQDWIKVGQGVGLQVVSRPGRPIHGTVAFIDPFTDAKSRTTHVRIDVANPDRALLPGMYVTAHLRYVVDAAALAVPDSAVIRTGERDVVILDRGAGHMQPRQVTLGPLIDGYYQVLAGLSAGEKVITQASFLIDSESQLQEALQQMGGGGAHAGKTKVPGTMKMPMNMPGM